MSVEVTVEDDVTEIRLARPEKKNAVTSAMYEAAIEALSQAAARSRVILFTAKGDAFCAGNDINDFLSTGSDFAQAPPARFIAALARNHRPAVAAVQGQAVGIGATLLLHCDLVYASPDAVLSMPFVDLGVVPEAGSSRLLPARIGTQRAAAMLLLGEKLAAEAALQAGLINAIVPASDLREHALARARALAAKPPAALAAARALMRGDEDLLLAHMEREQQAFTAALRSEEARRAMKAFLHRRS